MTLPNFLVIGAAKSGTSALCNFLGQHPEVHIPFKEPNFFSGWGTRVKFNKVANEKAVPPEYPLCGSLDEYRALFSNSGDAIARGEGSVSYLIDEHAANNIHDLIPDMKLIMLLRQPVDRAFSHFHFNRRLGSELETNFREVIAQEPDRLEKGWMPVLCPMHSSHYVPQLRRYFALFPREQMRIFLFEDWNREPDLVWDELVDFLGISTAFRPDFSVRYGENRRSLPAWAMMRRAAPYFKKLIPASVWARMREYLKVRLNPRVGLDAQLRADLTRRYFHEEIIELQDLLERDLTHWL